MRNEPRTTAGCNGTAVETEQHGTPPRERPEDVPVLVRYFARRMSKRIAASRGVSE
jgi:hypothetical protein